MAKRMVVNPDDIQVERLFVLGDNYAEQQAFMQQLCEEDWTDEDYDYLDQCDE